MSIVTINGQDVTLAETERLNVVQAAKKAGVEIPHYCWHPSLSVVASCRMCLVEVGEKKPDGSVAMMPKLVPACQTPAKDNTVVVTDSAKVKEAQAATLEYLLLNHPLDCPTCDQAGECFLQDYSYRFGRAETRLKEPKLIKEDKDYIGDQITLFTDRCVMCSRCVRFTREISGTSELQIIDRGDHAEIDIFPGSPCNNKLAGNVVDLCPVGALCSKDFLYKQRVWWLKSRDSVCPGCSTGCSIYVDQNEDHVYRLRPRENHLAQGQFMCDEGRFGYKYVHAEERLTVPEWKQTHTATNGHAGPRWMETLNHVRESFKQLAKKNGQEIAAVFSPWMTCEEAYLLALWLKKLSPKVRLTLGPIPVEGEDDCYPKNWRGEPLEPTRFTIRAEKCPNRLGVAAVLAQFQPSTDDFSSVRDAARNGQLQAAYVVGGGPPGWLSSDDVKAFAQVPLLVVQDILRSELTAAAHVVLPGASFNEKDGTYVNHAGLAQMIFRSTHPMAEGYNDTRIFMELAQREGLFNAKVMRKELAQQISAFRPLSVGDLGPTGVFLPTLQPTPLKAVGANA
ncbi:MAG: molybdopterin-dependent oxidoreductase [Bythopirellula sp.]|nr:molybdopterin-dependent oxidoreductase [Bythopirellula sp.]